MLTHSDWQIVKKELKSEISHNFIESELSISLDEVIDTFQSVLMRGDASSETSGRSDIETLLKELYVEGNIKLAGSTLDVLSGKLEWYLKKVFKITKQRLLGDGNGMLAHHLKTIFRVFRTTNGHPHFINFTETYITEFFKQNQPNYNNPSYFKNAHIFGDHFKHFYTSRNDEAHSYKNMRKSEILSTIESILVVYIYVTYLYFSKLRQEVVHEPDRKANSNWGIFRQYCGDFNKNATYFLITDRLNLSEQQLVHFANIKWDFVFDLDIKSDIRGLYSTIKASNYFPQTIYQIIHTSDDGGKIKVSFPANTTFWYYINGKESSPKSLTKSTKIFDWRTMYLFYTQNLMKEYYEQNYSNYHKPIKVIILSKDIERVKDIIYAIRNMNAFNLTTDFIFANEDNSVLQSLVSEVSAKDVDLSLTTLAEGFRELKEDMFSSTSSINIYLPSHSSKGKSVQLPSDVVLSVRQYFQIIHLSILHDEQEQASDKSFYQGRGISWRELENRYDIDRDITKELMRTVKKLLEKRPESGIVYLTHYAGVGGSTVAKRVAFELFREYPVLLLNEIVPNFDENTLADKLFKLFQVTGLPTLVIVDNSNITRQQIENLTRFTSHRLAKTVFLIVESSFVDTTQEKDGHYMARTLSPKEVDRFHHKFLKEYPNKKENFENLLRENKYTLNPFLFGLVANEENYITIEEYVSKRLNNINENEKNYYYYFLFVKFLLKESYAKYHTLW